MAVYFVVDVDVTDPVGYEEYRSQVAPTIAHYGGKFVVRGGSPLTIEGGWQSNRIVIIEFADADAFHRWYDSEEYTPLKQLRFKTSTARAVLVQGA